MYNWSGCPPGGSVSPGFGPRGLVNAVQHAQDRIGVDVRPFHPGLKPSIVEKFQGIGSDLQGRGMPVLDRLRDCRADKGNETGHGVTVIRHGIKGPGPRFPTSGVAVNRTSNRCDVKLQQPASALQRVQAAANEPRVGFGGRPFQKSSFDWQQHVDKLLQLDVL